MREVIRVKKEMRSFWMVHFELADHFGPMGERLCHSMRLDFLRLMCFFYKQRLERMQLFLSVTFNMP
jgi:hypothetical protein